MAKLISDTKDTRGGGNNIFLGFFGFFFVCVFFLFLCVFLVGFLGVFVLFLQTAAQTTERRKPLVMGTCEK